MEIIDKSAWPRREIFEFFSHVSNPFYMVTFRQDVTELVDFTKMNQLSFYYSLCWLCTKAINEIEAFQYVIKGENIYRLDGRIPSFTDRKKDSELFHIVTMPLSDSLKQFDEEARIKSRNQNCFINLEEESENLLYLSCLPWVDITALTNERDLADPGAKDESIPHIAWGKYINRDGIKELGISIEVNHRLIDGSHIGMFAEKLSEKIKELSNIEL